MFDYPIHESVWIFAGNHIGYFKKWPSFWFA